MKPLFHWKIKTQFNIIVASLLIICIILGNLVNNFIQNLTLKNKIAYTQNIALKFKGEVNYLFQHITTLYEYLQFDENIEALFIAPFTAHTLQRFDHIQSKILSLSIMNTDIADISFVSNDIHYSSLFDYHTLDTLHHKIIGSPSLSSLGIMTSSFIDSALTRYLVFGRNIYGFRNSEHYGDILGSIILSINPTHSTITLPRTSDLDTYFILLDKENNIYPFNCTDDLANIIMSNLTNSPDYTLLSNSEELVQINTEDYIIYASYISSIDYYVLNVIDRNKLFSDLKDTRIFIFFILFIIILCMVFLMRILLTNIINPINELYLFIQSISKGNMRNLKNSITLDGGKEIQTLSHEFNQMLSEIVLLNKRLFDTTTHLYESELEKNKAEIAHLRSQINPHFLYNTLESIRGIALENKVPQIATLCTSMGKMFRYSIKGAPTALLSEELAIVRAYLDIQTVRFDTKFHIFWSTNQATLHCYVPKMILQPLVENAIFHGLEKKLDIGTLYIGSKVNENNHLQITIQDDGIGISPTKLDELNTFLNNTSLIKNTSSTHIGLLNVHNRIFLAYGHPYGLELESEEGIGTKIILVLPINYVEKRDLDV